MAKKYLLYIHDERFDKEQKKSALVNELIAKHYGAFETVNRILAEAPLGKGTVEQLKALAAIPGIERASEAKCRGTHFMDRTNCGKRACPW